MTEYNMMWPNKDVFSLESSGYLCVIANTLLVGLVFLKIKHFFMFMSFGSAFYVSKITAFFVKTSFPNILLSSVSLSLSSLMHICSVHGACLPLPTIGSIVPSWFLSIFSYHLSILACFTIVCPPFNSPLQMCPLSLHVCMGSYGRVHVNSTDVYFYHTIETNANLLVIMNLYMSAVKSHYFIQNMIILRLNEMFLKSNWERTSRKLNFLLTFQVFHRPNLTSDRREQKLVSGFISVVGGANEEWIDF